MSFPSFGARNPVPANLLMMVLIVGGIWSGLSLRREFFPEIDPEAARVELVYPGATARELEESMARKVEDAIGTVEDVKRIETTVSEGTGVVVVKFQEGTDVAEGVSDVERAIERLSDLPDEAEKIRVLEFEPNLPVVIVTLFGDTDERTLKRGLRRIADDLDSLPGMGSQQVSGLRDYEIRIEVDPDRLVEYGIPITEVADAIRAWMLELPQQQSSRVRHDATCCVVSCHDCCARPCGRWRGGPPACQPCFGGADDFFGDHTGRRERRD